MSLEELSEELFASATDAEVVLDGVWRKQALAFPPTSWRLCLTDETEVEAASWTVPGRRLLYVTPFWSFQAAVARVFQSKISLANAFVQSVLPQTNRSRPTMRRHAKLEAYVVAAVGLDDPARTTHQTKSARHPHHATTRLPGVGRRTGEDCGLRWGFLRLRPSCGCA
jgi:hypothetical protein